MDRKEISKIVFRPNFFEIGLFGLSGAIHHWNRIILIKWRREGASERLAPCGQQSYVEFTYTGGTKSNTESFAELAWKRHDNEALSALLTFCKGNPAVDSPIKGSVMQSFGVYFVVSLPKLVKISRVARNFRCHYSCDVTAVSNWLHGRNKKHHKKILYALQTFVLQDLIARRFQRRFVPGLNQACLADCSIPALDN